MAFQLGKNLLLSLDNAPPCDHHYVHHELHDHVVLEDTVWLNRLVLACPIVLEARGKNLV